MAHSWVNPYRILCIVIFACGFAASAPAQAAENVYADGGAAGLLSLSEPKSAQLTYVSGGHALGFRPEGLVVAARDHALRVEFIGAKAVAPEGELSMPADAPSRSAQAPDHVTYPNLWEGISLNYDRPEAGIVRSTYVLEPFAHVEQIRLRYNAPVNMLADGSLAIDYTSGEMIESAPLAWQEIEGRHQPIAVHFRAISDHEIGFALGAYNARYPLTIDPTLIWNSFFGSGGHEQAKGVAIDSAGNVLIVGNSDAPWGSPIRTYTRDDDAFVAKLNSTGALLWNTFLGGSGFDGGTAIALDKNDRVYVTGFSSNEWGTPVAAFHGVGGYYDAFVARLGTGGAIEWSTFVGGNSSDDAFGIKVDSTFNIYITGQSFETWGTPKRSFTAMEDAFVARLTYDGNLTWNTFLGGNGNDVGLALALDSSGLVYIAGNSDLGWGTPKRGFSSNRDAFAAKLDSNGDYLWHTFLGTTGFDDGNGIAVDTNGNVYVTGKSQNTWGTPLIAFSGGTDAFVAKLLSDGSLSWNTFLGGTPDNEEGKGIGVDTNGYVYVTGRSLSSWGSPIHPYTPGRSPSLGELFAAKLSTAGALVWNTFLGGDGSDEGDAITLDGSGNVYAAGASYRSTWGSPINQFRYYDAPVIKLTSAGALSWAKFLEDDGNEDARGVALNSNGTLFLIGSADYGSDLTGGLGTGFGKYDVQVGISYVPGLGWDHNYFGGAGEDYGTGVVVDSSNNIYVTGYSSAGWTSNGGPISAHAAGDDAFVARIDSFGDVIWFTFLGGSGNDQGHAIAVDANHNIYVTGYSTASWGLSPERAYTAGSDAFVAMLGPNGALILNTFLGGSGTDVGNAIAVDGDEAYITGYSTATWGVSPVQAYHSGFDAFAAKLTGGLLTWNTFLGGNGTDAGNGIAIHSTGNVYLTGYSSSTWGFPKRPYSAGTDAFAAQLSSAGTSVWNTFLGGSGTDQGNAITLDAAGNLVLAGTSDASWGLPLRAYTAGKDAFVAGVDHNGNLRWNAFAGGGGDDYGQAVAVDPNGSVFAAGYSDKSWGAPLRAYTAGTDGFVAKFITHDLFLPLITR